MRVAYVTAGGAGMFCGSCMRDNTLAAALLRLGVDVTLIPTFTPIRTDEPDVSLERVFLGGLNLYLEQWSPWLGRLPRAARRLLDHPRLLRAISSWSLARRGAADGAIAVSLLRGEHGKQAALTDDLVEFVADSLDPDLVCLTNLLIAGFVPALKRRAAVPVVVTLQGDDLFLDSLAAGDREAVLREMRRLAAWIDGFLVFSRDYRDRMAALLHVPDERFQLVPIGLADPTSFARYPRANDPHRPTVGYLARICPEKGFELLVRAFVLLRRQTGMQTARLDFGGWLGRAERPFLAAQWRRLSDAGAAGAVRRHALPDRDSKARFLSGLDVFCVPAVYREPKAIFVLEALAAGVPVVAPAHGCFPELLAATGGGRLVRPNDPVDLARALAELLGDPERRARLGREGQRAVAGRFDDEQMARRTLDVWRGLVDRSERAETGAPSSRRG
ncbi:MAG TPA: glycosyltransferase family 4 protein [Candidatus Polarisedimenticolaceae bacterium]|nr:glycosyltransferase family 4 protein [Candidatus Polarisedimenticolaceae bacterium]